MATKKISELSPAGTLDGTEQVEVVQSGDSYRSTTRGIANTASTLQLANTGLGVNDTDASHKLTIKPGSDLTANRTLTLPTGDADRTVVLGDVQDLSGAGAVNLTTLTTKWTTTGADAGTLTDGEEGQLKIIVMVADGGDGTLTPTNFANGSTITFNDVGDSVMLQFLDGEWWIVSNNGATVA